MATTTKDNRVNFRIHTDIKANIEAAARLCGLSVSDFMIQAAARAATEVIGEHSVLHLSEQEFSRFCAALEADIAPNEAALAAAQRFNETTVEVSGVRHSR